MTRVIGGIVGVALVVAVVSAFAAERVVLRRDNFGEDLAFIDSFLKRSWPSEYRPEGPLGSDARVDARYGSERADLIRARKVSTACAPADFDGGADVGLAGEGDGAAVQRHQRIHQRNADTGSGGTRPSRHADPGIADRDREVLIRGGGDRDPATLGGELDRVGDQVDEDLAKPCADRRAGGGDRPVGRPRA